jgi:hypothetical protein
MGREGRKRKLLLDRKESTEYWKLIKEAADCAVENSL